MHLRGMRYDSRDLEIVHTQEMTTAAQAACHVTVGVVRRKTQGPQSPRLLEFPRSWCFGLSSSHGRDTTQSQLCSGRPEIGSLTRTWVLWPIWKLWQNRIHLELLFIALSETTVQHLVMEMPHSKGSKFETGMEASIDSVSVFWDKGHARIHRLFCRQCFVLKMRFLPLILSFTHCCFQDSRRE